MAETAPLVLGIDIGTTAIKVIVLECVSRSQSRPVRVKSMPHDLISLHPGWAEEDASVWEEHLFALLKELSAESDLSNLKAIGLTGMVPALIMLDENDRPLRMSIQQNDMRTSSEIEYLSSVFEKDNSYFERTGSHVNSQHTAPRLLWLKKHEPEVFDSTKYIFGSYDWAGFLLTGHRHIEENWALESGMYALEGGWIPEVLDAVGIRAEMLPPVVRSNEKIGVVSKAAALRSGLREGIPVYAGTADHVASAFCTGARKDGDLVLKMGGAGDILVSLDHLVKDGRLFIDYFCSQSCHYVLNGCTAASGSLLKWFTREFGGDFKELDRDAEKIPAGSEGVVVLPYVLGEKTPIFDPDARGVIYGFMLSHTKAHIYRAMMESVAFAFRHHIDVFRERGISIGRVFITNGGSTSPLWRQIMADVTGYPVAYIKTNPGSCLGAAFIAGISSGLLTEDAIEDFTSQKIFSYPDPSTKDAYDRAYSVYRKLYPSLKDIFKLFRGGSASS